MSNNNERLAVFDDSDIESMVATKVIPDTTEARLGAAETLSPKSSGNPDLKEQSFFTDYEFEVWAESVREYSRMGWPFSESRFREMLQDGVRAGYRKMVHSIVDHAASFAALGGGAG